MGIDSFLLRRGLKPTKNEESIGDRYFLIKYYRDHTNILKSFLVFLVLIFHIL